MYILLKIDGILRVKWNCANGLEEHDGFLPLHYLKKHSYSAVAHQRKHRESKPAVAVTTIGFKFPTNLIMEKISEKIICMFII